MNEVIDDLTIQVENLQSEVNNLKKESDFKAGDLIFHEPFDTLNLSTWEHALTMGGGGNWEFEMYYNNRTNSYVKDSTLFIQPTLTSDIIGDISQDGKKIEIWGNTPADLCTGNQYYGCERTAYPNDKVILPPVYSAQLKTANSFSCKFCRVEVEAKLPKGDWIWPAIWMLPRHLQYGQWPASGEIDIMESRGNSNLKIDGSDIGVQCYGATLHYGPFWPANGFEKAHKDYCLSSGTFNDEFHTFAVDWREDYISFELDGEEILKVDPGKNGFWGLGNFENDYPGISNPWITSGSALYNARF